MSPILSMASVTRPSAGFRAVLAVLLAAHLSAPGHTRWIADMPLLIMNAWTANQYGELAARGLIGTVGFHYGAIPTWVYQLLLGVSDDLVVAVALKNALTLAVYVLCACWFVRALELSPWPALLPLLSPTVFDYDRVLWDNVWQWPVSLLAVTALGRFWQDGAPRSLYVLAACGSALVQIHLMSGLLLSSIGVTLLLCDRPALWRQRRHVFLAGLLGLASAAPYLWSALSRFQAPLTGGGASAALLAPGGADLQPLFEAWRGLSAVRVFSTLGLTTYFPELLRPGPLQVWALSSSFVSGLIVPMWLVACGAALRHLRGRWGRAELDARDRLLVLGLIAPAASALLVLVMGIPYQSHYIGAVWFPHFFVLWWWLDRAITAPSPLVLRVAKLQAVASACGFALFLAYLHQERGNQDVSHGPVLSVQLEAARKVASQPAGSRLSIDSVPLYRFDPFTFHSLLQLQLARTGPVAGAPKLLVVRPAADGPLGELTVAEGHRR